MKMIMLRKNLLLFACLVFMASTLSAQDYKYIGAEKCKMCHNKTDKGEQYKKWTEESHSKAMLSLSNAKSMEYAKKNNIADPAKEAKCLKCHSTAGAVDKKLHSGITIEGGVSCESCHGPGSAYKAPSIMKNKAQALENGLIEPNQKTCEKCHNKENPFFKPFDYASAVKKIAHPNPKKK